MEERMALRQAEMPIGGERHGEAGLRHADRLGPCALGESQGEETSVGWLEGERAVPKGHQDAQAKGLVVRQGMALQVGKQAGCEHGIPGGLKGLRSCLDVSDLLSYVPVASTSGA